jgi:hypothetical protein
LAGSDLIQIKWRPVGGRSACASLHGSVLDNQAKAAKREYRKPDHDGHQNIWIEGAWSGTTIVVPLQLFVGA